MHLLLPRNYFLLVFYLVFNIISFLYNKNRYSTIKFDFRTHNLNLNWILYFHWPHIMYVHMYMNVCCAYIPFIWCGSASDTPWLRPNESSPKDIFPLSLLPCKKMHILREICMYLCTFDISILWSFINICIRIRIYCSWNRLLI